jgi:hypothetical protein
MSMSRDASVMIATASAQPRSRSREVAHGGCERPQPSSPGSVDTRHLRALESGEARSEAVTETESSVTMTRQV